MLNFNKYRMVFLWFCLYISGCSHNNLNYASDNGLAKNKQAKEIKFQSLARIQEYVARIGKRLLIVNDYSNEKKANIAFKVNPNNLPILDLSYNLQDPNRLATINISRGLLDYLEDEAELAAILAISLEILHDPKFNPNNFSYNIQADYKIIQHLYRAGYDPNALVELQTEYLRSINLNDHWLKVIFYNAKINATRIQYNTQVIQKIPKGLQRNKENFLSNLYLFP